MNTVKIAYSLFCRTFSISHSAIYGRVKNVDNELFLTAEVYNLFVVATIIALFICKSWLDIFLKGRVFSNCRP